MKLRVIIPKSLLAASATGLLALAAVLPARADYSNTVASFNPLGYWRLNEIVAPPVETGTVIATNTGTGGSALNGVYINYGTRGLPGVLAGSSDTAAAFSGTSQHVDIPYDATLNTTIFSAEIWANPAAPNGAGAVMSSGEPAAGSRTGWVLYQFNDRWSFRPFINSGNLTVVGDANGILSGAGTVAVGAWQHLVVVNDGVNCLLYVNGVLDGSFSSSTYVAALSGGTTLGRRWGSANNFNGTLDESAFYTNALSASDVLAHYQNGLNAARTTPYETLVGSSSPVAYYRLNEPGFVGPTAMNSGSLAAAADGNYGIGTTPGQAGPTSVPGLGVDNVACQFSGAAQIGCGNNAGLNVSQISLAAWFKVGTQVANMSIVAKGSSLWRLQMDGTTKHLKWVCSGGGVTGVKFVNDGLWHHVVAVAGPSGSAMYVDGVLDASNATPVPSLPTTTEPVTISAKWNGSLDEVALFGTALSQADALAIYNAAEPPARDTTVNATTSTVVAAPPAAWADVVPTAKITVTCLNAGGLAVDGKTVTLVSDRGATDTITPASGISDPNGQVVFMVQSSTVGYGTFSATADAVPVTQTPIVAFSPKPPPVTTYVTGSTVITNWNFTNSQQSGWTVGRTTVLTDAGLQLGSAIPELPDHGAMVGMMRITPPAALTWINAGAEVTYYAPHLVPPTSGYEFLYMWKNSPRTGFGVLADNAGAPNFLRTSARTKQENGGPDSSWTVPVDPTLGTGLDGLHTMALVRNGDLSLDTYLDGVKVNTRSTLAIAGTGPEFISIGWNVNGNMYVPFGTIVSQVRAFTVNPLVGAVDTNLSTVVASPTGAWADGIAFSTITVTLRDGTSALVPGKTVTLAKTSGGGTPVITTLTGVTGGDGKAIFKVASTTVAADVFTATDTTDGKVIVQTATVNFVVPTVPSINVNFDTQLRAGLVGPAGGLGTTWNQFVNLLELPGQGNLVDSNNVGTTVGFTCDAGGIGIWGSTTLEMLNGAAFRFGSATFNLVITNLPAGEKYDLYLPSYVQVRDGSSASFTTANTTPTPLPLLCNNGGGNSDSTTWIEGQNYVVLRGVEPDIANNISVAVSGQPEGHENQLNGFQIQESILVPLVATISPPNVGGDVTITFDTVVGSCYRVEYTDTLPPIWQEVFGSKQGTGLSESLTDIAATAGSPQRFYRVKQVPGICPP